jgi:hypothetical protein
VPVYPSPSFACSIWNWGGSCRGRRDNDNDDCRAHDDDNGRTDNHDNRANDNHPDPTHHDDAAQHHNHATIDVDEFDLEHLQHLDDFIDDHHNCGSGWPVFV